jgi:hypothetical protein
MIDFEIIEKRFIEIRDKGFHANVKSDDNDGAAGNTFESLFDIKENSKREADFGVFEFKTKKYLKSKSPISLFTQRPSSQYDDNYMRKNWGYPDKRYKDILCFRTSLYTNRWSLVNKKHQMKIEVDKNAKKVFIIRADLNFKIIDKNVYWDFDDILKGTKKLKNLFLVGANEKVINGKKHFSYIDATVYTDYLGDLNFIKLLKEGVIRYDNRLGVHGPKTDHPGTEHNHGGGFRIPKSQIDRLYKNKIIIPTIDD